MKTALVILTVLVLESTSALDNMGLCNVAVSPVVDMDFKEFASENNGSGCEYIVPKTAFLDSLQSLSSNLQPTAKEYEYDLTMTYIKKDGTTGLFTQEVMNYIGGGVAESKGVSKGTEYTLIVSFLKVVEGRYVMYHVCSDDGTDTEVDYRYVMARAELSDDDLKDIKDINDSYGFKGELIILPQSCGVITQKTFKH